MKGKSALILSSPSLTSMQAVEVRRFDDPTVRDKDIVQFVIVDHLAIHKLWPDYVLDRGTLLRRVQKLDTPEGKDSLIYFGRCEYRKTTHVREGKTHTIMILEE